MAKENRLLKDKTYGVDDKRCLGDYQSIVKVVVVEEFRSKNNHFVVELFFDEGRETPEWVCLFDPLHCLLLHDGVFLYVDFDIRALL